MKKLIFLCAILWVQTIYAQEIKNIILRSPSTSTTFLDKEAGVSAYYNVSQTIDLAKAKEVFCGLERETADYIIGSVRPSEYTEDENNDVHCFVHKDGWILTYYTKDEPCAIIFDYKAYKADSSKVKTVLKKVIDMVCGKIGLQPPSEVSYYDFRYPNANRLVLIVDAKWGNGWETMYLTIPNEPGTLTVYETSWSHAAYDSLSSQFKVDDTVMNTFGDTDNIWGQSENKFSPSLSLGKRHKIELYNQEGSYRPGDVFLAISVLYYEKE